jgi:hypothetical protein
LWERNIIFKNNSEDTNSLWLKILKSQKEIQSHDPNSSEQNLPFFKDRLELKDFGGITGHSSGCFESLILVFGGEL